VDAALREIDPVAQPLKIYLIRHGETAWSRSGQHTSFTDIALTEQGEQEARMLGERLRAISFTHVFSSPRRRAQQTYALSGLAVTVETDPDLSEWNYGDYEGLRTVEIRKMVLRRMYCDFSLSPASSPTSHSETKSALDSCRSF
jgi:broad specificity phosphatase PhoE